MNTIYTKEDILKRIQETDKTLGYMKQFFNEHSGEEITDEELIQKIKRLEYVSIQLLKDINFMKKYLLEEYGLFVFTENGV